ncbi:MAG: hypothetical protein AAF639_27220 [Chloroflexota bacterium]
MVSAIVGTTFGHDNNSGETTGETTGETDYKDAAGLNKLDVEIDFTEFKQSFLLP